MYQFRFAMTVYSHIHILFVCVDEYNYLYVFITTIIFTQIIVCMRILLYLLHMYVCGISLYIIINLLISACRWLIN